MRDVPLAIRQWLIEQPTLAALTQYTRDNGEVDYRIHVETDDPPAGYTPADGPAVCLKIRGGNLSFSDALVKASLQVSVFDESEMAAQESYRTLFEAMHNGRGAYVRWGQSDVLGQTLRDPSSGWWYVLAYFTVSVAKD